MGERKKKLVRVVFDTNIWVSIALDKTLATDLLPLIRIARIKVFLSDDLTNELARVLVYPKIRNILDKAQVDPVVALSGVLQLASKSNLHSTNKRFTELILSISEIKDDPDDNRVLECALASHSKLIVSGDKHLLELREFRGIEIVKEGEFLEIMKIDGKFEPT
ncbi:MAG: putative toxin-antitoxin system toxin component, PIN family [Nitrososphaerales archaeon]